MRARWLIAALALAFACESTEASRAPATAAAGEGMCEEHGVLEALCTKCNPALAAVFEAKGDWCEEHGFPESICPICHPERGGRPAREVADDGAPADGTKVRFRNKDVAGVAGIETVQAVEKKEDGGLVALARIAYDATKVAIVNPRAAGVLKKLHVDVGSMVGPGARLATIESAEVGGDRSRLVAARSRVETARATLDRERQLREKGISAERDVQAARQELEAAKSELAALESAVGVVGRGEAGAYLLSAPIGGTVTRRSATIGALVAPEEPIFEIVDVSSMWVEIEVPERDLAAVQAGQAVTVEVDGLEQQKFRGTIAYVAPEIDPKTRTVLARAPLENPSGTLRANMFARARIDVGAERAAVVVPTSAVQRARSATVVFVKLADDQYETRRVTVGATDGRTTTILKGVAPGEEVVTTGSFLLKTETLKESIGAGCCEADERK